MSGYRIIASVITERKDDKVMAWEMDIDTWPFVPRIGDKLGWHEDETGEAWEATVESVVVDLDKEPHGVFLSATARRDPDLDHEPSP